jgi:hypothetical protein
MAVSKGIKACIWVTNTNSKYHLCKNIEKYDWESTHTGLIYNFIVLFSKLNDGYVVVALFCMSLYDTRSEKKAELNYSEFLLMVFSCK